MKNNIILLAVATLALNSCGIYKKYEPVTTLPENLYREEIAPADTFSIGNISWRDLFTDPALQSLIERGLANNTAVTSLNEAQTLGKVSFLLLFATARHCREVSL